MVTYSGKRYPLNENHPIFNIIINKSLKLIKEKLLDDIQPFDVNDPYVNIEFKIQEV